MGSSRSRKKKPKNNFPTKQISEYTFLSFVDTQIILLLSCQISNGWFSFSELNKSETIFKKETKLDIEKLFAGQVNDKNSEILTIPSMIPPKLVDSVNNVTMQPSLKIQFFDDGFAMISVYITLSGSNSVKNINHFINHIFNSNDAIIFENTRMSFNQWAMSTLTTVSNLLNLAVPSDMLILYETFSVINFTTLNPNTINSENYIGSPYECDLYEAAIRRVSDISESRIEVSREQQDNLSLYKKDFVFLNYHNLFVYVESKDHISMGVYLEIVEQYKIHIAKLKCILKEVELRISSTRTMTNSLRKLQAESDWIDHIRLRQIRANEQFNKALDIASTRVSWFKKATNEKLRWRELQDRLNEDVSNYEDAIARRLSLKQDRILQFLSATLAALSIIISIIGIIWALPSNDRPDAQPTSSVQLNIQQVK